MSSLSARGHEDEILQDGNSDPKICNMYRRACFPGAPGPSRHSWFVRNVTLGRKAVAPAREFRLLAEIGLWLTKGSI